MDDDKILTKTLLKRFKDEAEVEGGDGRHYAMIRLAGGKLFCHHPGSPQLMPEQSMWAADILALLNRELHHDGAWVVVFTHPIAPDLPTVLHATPSHWEYGRFAIIWLDQDGDPQFTVEWQKGESELLDFYDVMLAGRESIANQCEGARMMWHHHMRKVIDPKQHQLYRAAMGEAAPSTRH